MKHYPAIRLLFSSLVCLTVAGCTTIPNTVTTTQNAATTLCSSHTSSPHLPVGDVLALAQQKSQEAYNFTQGHGAQIIPVDDNKSYVVWWQPDGFNPTTDTVVVSLHGHGEWAIKDFEVWYPELTKRHYAYLGVQWWFGRSLEPDGYYEPDQIYSIITKQLAAQGIPKGNIIFQGFSMGSARSYAITLLDHLCGADYFGVTISNAGQWEDDYNSNVDVLAGKYGSSPYAGTHWILFCGVKDDNEHATFSFSNVCDGMTYTQDVLTKYGGTVDLFLKDPDGDHGSFMINPDNRTIALDLADTI